MSEESLRRELEELCEAFEGCCYQCADNADIIRRILYHRNPEVPIVRNTEPWRIA